MARSFTEVCPDCYTVFTAKTIAAAQNQAANCRCTLQKDDGPDLKTALENAKRELGDWNDS